MIFDTHCHLAFELEDAHVVHERAVHAGVTRMLNVGIDLASSQRAQRLAGTLAGVSWSAGLHPNDSQHLAEQWDELSALMRQPDCVAIGETGLDFYRDRASKEQQVESLERHLSLALDLNKPVILHCREAFAATYEVLRRFPGVRGVMHCFSGGPREAEQALAAGLHLSFAGPLTYPKAHALREAAAMVPKQRVLIETDAPFLAPQAFRGKRNEPAFVVATLEQLASLRSESVSVMAKQTHDNACALFAV